MTAKLQQMQQQCLADSAASDASRTQRLVAQCCLASFISFLTFATAADTNNSTDSFLDADSSNDHFRPALDLSAALLAAVKTNKLAWVVPWVVHCLQFLGRDSFAHSSSYMQQLMRQLQALHVLPMLLPEHPGFGPMQLCLRCVLDDHLEQAQEIEVSETELGEDWQAAVSQLEQLSAEGGRLSGDSRYMQLCCPALESARQALQVSYSPVGSCEPEILFLQARWPRLTTDRGMDCCWCKAANDELCTVHAHKLMYCSNHHPVHTTWSSRVC